MLFFVRILLIKSALLASFVSYGEESLFKEADLDVAKNIASSGKMQGLEAIRKKYREFKKMKSQFHKENIPQADMDSQIVHNTQIDRLNEYVSKDIERQNPCILKVFVSSSMNKSLLKAYARSAKKYGAVLIFNGLPEGSFRSLSNLVFDITEDETESFAMQIDDTAFEEYKIKAVPSFVLVKEQSIWDSDFDGNTNSGFSQSTAKSFDKVSGNIGIRRALEMFAKKGELSEESEEMLEQAGRGRDV